MDPVTKWFLMDAATVEAALSDCAARHAEYGEGELSVVWNVAGTDALVKVVGADDDWLAAQPWAGDVTATYTEATHGLIFEWFYTPEWQPPEEE